MSRCFPFPPPGYEKKIRIDETDLLTKEKQKEKKHKKDKKDKEKKDGKEKHDKERSKDKHKEKKEKKEKHKDKKDRDKEKDKNRTSVEKKAESWPDEKGSENLLTNFLRNNNNLDTKYAQELARRIRDEEKATGSQVLQKSKIPEQRSTGLPGRTVESNNGYPFKEINHKREDNKRAVSGQRSFTMAKSSEISVARDLLGANQKRFEGTAKPVEKKDITKQMEGKEKIQSKESDNKSDKPKNKVRDKRSVLEVKNGDTETKKEERMEETNRSSLEQPKFIGGPRLKEKDKGSLDTHNSNPPDLPRPSNTNLAGGGNLGKLKEIETNGCLYENGNRPQKLQKSIFSSLSTLENGRKLPPSQIPTNSSSELQGVVTNCKPEIKEHRINGFIEVKKPKVLPPSSLLPTVEVHENGEAPKMTPHPDSKYLTEILAVPKKELPERDDLEWLFGSTELKPKRPKVDSPGVDETQRVWDQALSLESADISALPYVIPY